MIARCPEGHELRDAGNASERRGRFRVSVEARWACSTCGTLMRVRSGGRVTVEPHPVYGRRSA